MKHFARKIQLLYFSLDIVFFYAVCEVIFKCGIYVKEGQLCLMHFFDIKRSFQVSLYVTTCYRTVTA